MLEGEELLERAAALGAAEGFGPMGAVPLRHLDDERVAGWLALGYAGEMAYIERHLAARRNPAEAFRPALSCLSFLVPYETEAPSPDPGIGNLARYALGDDYHEVLKTKARRVLAGLLEIDPEMEGRVLVDTAPLMEKSAAERAGLGWRGKHTNLIRTGTGSWFFLAEILVDREVPEPRPAADRCGTCTACIEACPTGAIVAPYVLDARLCISYLTIELRGSIPEALRPALGHRVFGCDDCQEVCPWNRDPVATRLPELRSRPGLRRRSLVDWLRMDLETWRLTFRRSAVKRAKYEGFKRNVAVALGCLADPETVPALEDAFAVEPPLVRRHLAWALGVMPAGAGRPALERLRTTEDDPEVLGEIDAALAASA